MAKAGKEAVRELLRVESSIIGAAKDAAIGAMRELMDSICWLVTGIEIEIDERSMVAKEI